jgi:hypothetical protein
MQSNLQREHYALQHALDRFQHEWARHRTVDALFSLSEAIDHAVEVVVLCEHLKTGRDQALRSHLMMRLRLTLLLTEARLARQSAYWDTLVPIRQRMGDAASSDRQMEARFPAGTIVSCPACGEGLYKLTARATLTDLVLDDGTLLTPLNPTIPRLRVWQDLACPHCGGRYYRDGQLYTLQYGWR